MIIKKYIGKKIDMDALNKDISDRTVTEVWFYKQGFMDDELDVIEFMISRTIYYFYALQVFLSGQTIQKIQRVKFEHECGGWRGENHPLKRFPIHMLGEAWAEEVIKDYMIK